MDVLMLSRLQFAAATFFISSSSRSPWDCPS